MMKDRTLAVAQSGLRPWPVRLLGLAVAMLALWAGVATLSRFLFGGNVGVVDEGLVYRSAQPVENLEALIDRYHLVTVLNLRGGSEADPWYKDEVLVTRRRGVDFYDIPLSAVRRPWRRELLVLLDLLDRCRYPLLIHCKSGSDRTGLVSGLYLMLRRGEPPERALRTFSIQYGHIPIGGPEHLHEPFLEYQTWLRSRGLTHTPARLRHWVEHDYRAPDPAVAIDPAQPGPRSQRRGQGR
jgi:protein tyrosine/serine phosphatase